MKQYLDLLRRVKEEGVDRPDRTGVGTRGIFGHQMRFDLREGFPLVTTKKVHLRSIIHELLWFVRGETTVESLHSAKVTIWDEWATAEQTARFGRKAGDLGPVYGHQWRNFGATPRADGTWDSDGVDQLKRLLVDLREKPFSRRHIVTGWNPKEADQVALPPCHTLFQFYVTPGTPETREAERSASSNASGGFGGEAPQHELSCHLYQRSGDVFLGVPFNIASYALFTMMIAQVSGMRAREFVHSFGDAHLYTNHFEQAALQLSREPRALPVMRINPEVRDLFAFEFEDFTLEGYDPHPAISAPVAV